MKRIQSFTVDHDLLQPGLYISRVDGDAATFDLRTRTPNSGDYMDNLTMHSVEHLFATVIRNGPMSDKVLYFGPMGCQTGFYLIIRDTAPEEVLAEIKRTLRAILDWEGEMPGSARKECGNYKNLSLAAGKEECRKYLEVLEHKKVDFQYEV